MRTLMEAYPAPMTFEEIRRDLREPKAFLVTDAINRLDSAGLIHRFGDFILPTRAAFHAGLRRPVSERAPRALTVVRTLRRRRRILELSQRELAARAGIGEKHLGEIERGLRDPRLSTLLRLLDALDLGPYEAAAFWEEAVAVGPRIRSPPRPSRPPPHYVGAIEREEIPRRKETDRPY